MKVNGATVISVTRVDWQTNDDAGPLILGRVVGRACVDVEGGGRFHGLVVTRSPMHERQSVVVWERDTGRFVAVPVPGDVLPIREECRALALEVRALRDTVTLSSEPLSTHELERYEDIARKLEKLAVSL